MNKETIEYFNGNELAANVWWTKYRNGDEISPKNMFDRIVKEMVIMEIERNSNLPEFDIQALSPLGHVYYTELATYNNSGKEDFLKTLFSELINFEYIIPAGSMLSGIGVPESFSTLSNCFVLGQPYDSYPGILEKRTQIVAVMKRRGGAGLDLSTIRPKLAVVRNQAKISSGPVLFANGYSETTKEVAQDGRRGALMLSLSINHPDSLEFIESKQDLTKITGANISVKLTEDFMKAVESDSDYLLRFPVDADMTNYNKEFIETLEYDKLTEIIYGNEVEPKHVKRIKAKDYWNAIIRCAHATAEPGLLFESNWEKYGIDYGYEEFRPISTNPCSEIPMQPFDACRLISSNLYSLVDNKFKPNASIDFGKLYKIFYYQLLLGDLCVDLEIKAIDNILDKISKSNDPENLKKDEMYVWETIKETAAKGRRCGAGFTALGDMLAALNLKYQDSEDTLHEIFTMKLKAELDATTDLAIIHGAFEGYDKEKEIDCQFVKMLQFEADFKYQYDRMLKYGRRNVSWSTAAPTGSLSLETQTTSGVEPLFSAFYKRRKKVMNEETERVDFTDSADGQKFTEYFVLHPKFVDWYIITNNLTLTHKEGFDYLSNLTEDELNIIFEKSPWYGACANDIDWNSRVVVQAIVQNYTTHAISSTINLPEDIDVETIGNIYFQSWKHGLKGNTVYREGSRSGILVNDKVEKPKVAENFVPTQAPKRPRTLPGHYHTIQSKGKTYSIIIGLMDNLPYEIFIISGVDNLPLIFDEHHDYITGNVDKDHKDWYNFQSKTFTVRDLTDVENGEKMLSLNLSAMLRHRIPVKYIIKVLYKTLPIAGSFTHRLIKVLSRYDTEISTGDKCPTGCGNDLKHEGGCVYCDCGWSKC